MTFNLSSREKAERDATLASPDPVVPNDPSSTAWTAAHAFSNTSVRQRTERAAALKAEAAKPKSYQEQVMDYHYGIYLAQQAREQQWERDKQQKAIDRENKERADREREQTRAIDRANKERADKEREQKRGQYVFRQRMRTDVFERNNSTEQQIAQVNQAAADAGLFDDLDYLEMTLKRIQLEAS
jgi:hypothetical protein